MREMIKTIFLTALVIVSLLQSWLLAYRIPAFDTVEPTNYLKPEKLGEEKKWTDIVSPYRIVFHYGDNGHTLLFPTTTYYQMVVRALVDRSFDVLQESKADAVDWSRMYEQTKGIELQFDTSVSLHTLGRWTSLAGSYAQDVRVDRVWLYYDESRNDMRALWISDADGRVYATRTDFPQELLQRYLAIGQYQSKYSYIKTSIEDSVPQGYYLPDEPILMAKYRLFYQPITADQMKTILFVDPSIVKQIQERDGSMIYTDGNRGLQIHPGERGFTYNSPVPPSESEQQTADAKTENLPLAVQFVNQHGGWNGTFRIYDRSEDPQGVERMMFRQYFGAYPIFEMEDPIFSEVQIGMLGGSVSTYSRSLLQMDVDAVIEEESIRTADKAELLAQLEAAGLAPSEIRNVRLAYQAELSNEFVDLVPVWMIETYTPKPLFIPASVAKKGAD
jgi:regulatory protein YycH of two-component signal transduction system YycFG